MNETIPHNSFASFMVLAPFPLRSVLVKRVHASVIWSKIYIIASLHRFDIGQPGSHSHQICPTTRETGLRRFLSLFSCVGVADDADDSVFGLDWLLSGENANSPNGIGWFCSFLELKSRNVLPAETVCLCSEARLLILWFVLEKVNLLLVLFLG